MTQVQVIYQTRDVRYIRFTAAAVDISLIRTAKYSVTQIKVINQTGYIGYIRCIELRTVSVAGVISTTGIGHKDGESP